MHVLGYHVKFIYNALPQPQVWKLLSAGKWKASSATNVTEIIKEWWENYIENFSRQMEKK